MPLLKEKAVSYDAVRVWFFSSSVLAVWCDLTLVSNQALGGQTRADGLTLPWI